MLKLHIVCIVLCAASFNVAHVAAAPFQASATFLPVQVEYADPSWEKHAKSIIDVWEHLQSFVTQKEATLASVLDVPVHVIIDSHEQSYAVSKGEVRIQPWMTHETFEACAAEAWWSHVFSSIDAEEAVSMQKASAVAMAHMTWGTAVRCDGSMEHFAEQRAMSPWVSSAEELHEKPYGAGCLLMHRLVHGDPNELLEFWTVSSANHRASSQGMRPKHMWNAIEGALFLREKYARHFYEEVMMDAYGTSWCGGLPVSPKRAGIPLASSAHHLSSKQPLVPLGSDSIDVVFETPWTHPLCIWLRAEKAPWLLVAQVITKRSMGEGYQVKHTVNASPKEDGAYLEISPTDDVGPEGFVRIVVGLGAPNGYDPTLEQDLSEFKQNYNLIIGMRASK